MKQFLKYTLLALLAGLIFYGGAGVNWVTYCCDNCFKIGIQMAVTESCCATHVPDDYIPTAPAERVATPLAIDGLHNCGIERVEFEWTVDNERSFTILPFITDALYHLSYTYLLTDSEGAVAIRFKEDDPPIVLPPRAYLTLLTTLLI